jgi:hypothetical protein
MNSWRTALENFELVKLVTPVEAVEAHRVCERLRFPHF